MEVEAVAGGGATTMCSGLGAGGLGLEEAGRLVDVAFAVLLSRRRFLASQSSGSLSLSLSLKCTGMPCVYASSATLYKVPNMKKQKALFTHPHATCTKLLPPQPACASGSTAHKP